MSELGKFFVFIVGGLLSAAIDIGIMELMIAFGINPISSATIGFIFGLVVNYFYHSFFTFKFTISLAVGLRFLFVVGINYLLTILFIFLSYSFFSFGVLPGKLLSLPVVALNGYLLSSRWVFK